VNHVTSGKRHGDLIAALDGNLKGQTGSAVFFQRTQKGLKFPRLQAAFGQHILIDRQQIADVGVLYHNVFLQLHFFKFEIQQSPAAQHRQRVQAAAECRAFVVDVGRKRRAQLQSRAVVSRNPDAHGLRERNLGMQGAFEQRGQTHVQTLFQRGGQVRCNGLQQLRMNVGVARADVSGRKESISAGKVADHTARFGDQ
jgi:hypothetical protein